MTIKRYLWDRSRESTAVVTAVGRGAAPWVRLNETLFHPQGGGQKADRGDIGGIPVTHVSITESGQVDHFIAGPVVPEIGDEVCLRIDPVWRTQQESAHSAGHLIAALLERRWPSLRACGGHHWPGESRVELEGSAPPRIEEIQASLKEDLLAAVASDLPVIAAVAPDGARTIQIGSFPPVPCGGTHIERSGQIGRLALGKIRLKGGRIRVSYTTTSPT
ncbi:alanyl-tRNA editing protein [Sorangium sp. So ce375]|uniref:alanyl-tRNA editing protein n=1 Tax=Sorangium sp. So ce375 TaxID=3133306 RepID=UPI003F5BC9F4